MLSTALFPLAKPMMGKRSIERGMFLMQPLPLFVLDFPVHEAPVTAVLKIPLRTPLPSKPGLLAGHVSAAWPWLILTRWLRGSAWRTMCFLGTAQALLLVLYLLDLSRTQSLLFQSLCWGALRFLAFGWCSPFMSPPTKQHQRTDRVAEPQGGDALGLCLSCCWLPPC